MSYGFNNKPIKILEDTKIYPDNIFPPLYIKKQDINGNINIYIKDTYIDEFGNKVTEIRKASIYD